MAALLRFLLRLMRRIEGVKSTINPKIACPFIIFSILSLYLLVSIIQSRRLIGSSNRSIDGKDANSSIYTAFGSDKFQSSLILASIITMPMALDAILDGFMLNRSTSDSIIWLTRLVLIFSVSMPNILLYMGTFQPDLSLDAYFCMNSFVDVASRGCICILLSQINQGDHGKLVCVSIVVFYTAGCYIHLHNQLKQSTTVDYVSIFFFVVAYCQYVYVFAQWATNWMFSGRKIDVDDICMIIYFLGIFIISAGSILITVSHRNELTSNSMALQNYLYLLFLVIVMTFPGQILRFNLRKTLHKMEDKEAFIRYISHEIRTPLNTVFLGMSYIKGELLGIAPLVSEYLEPILDTVNEVNSCCEVALSIVNDLLTFDKLEEGKMKLEVEETEIEKYLSGTILPFNIQAREKNIVISIIIDGADQGWQNSVVLRVDQHKLSQVIRNLVSNAIKFTPVEGTIVVTLSKVSVHMSTGKRHSSSSGSGSTLTHPEVLEKANFGSSLQKFTSELMGQLKSNHDDDVKPASVPVLKGGQYVDYLRIEVKDTGAGISEENQRKLFGQYVQFNASKLQQGNGSGLGLWISKGITELHGGTYMWF